MLKFAPNRGQIVAVLERTWSGCPVEWHDDGSVYWPGRDGCPDLENYMPRGMWTFTDADGQDWLECHLRSRPDDAEDIEEAHLEPLPKPLVDACAAMLKVAMAWESLRELRTRLVKPDAIVTNCLDLVQGRLEDELAELAEVTKGVSEL